MSVPGSFPDLGAPNRYVRFTPMADLGSLTRYVRKVPNNGLMRRAKCGAPRNSIRRVEQTICCIARELSGGRTGRRLPRRWAGGRGIRGCRCGRHKGNQTDG